MINKYADLFGGAGFTGDQMNNFDMKSPQSMAMFANLFHPLTKGIAGAGGMPALMSMYGQMTGNSDWNTAMTKQSPQGTSSPAAMPNANAAVKSAPPPTVAQPPATPNMQPPSGVATKTPSTEPPVSPTPMQTGSVKKSNYTPWQLALIKDWSHLSVVV